MLPPQRADAAPVATAAIPAPVRAPMADGPRPPLALVAPERGQEPLLSDAAPIPPAPAPSPAWPAPDTVTLAQAAEPSAPVQPSRVELEGGALPGTGTVRVRRPDAGPAPAMPDDAAEAPSDDAPASQRFAAPFEAPEGTGPLLSLVLLDDGILPEATGALAGLSVPVSVALDPSAPDAAQRMATYRAAGHEVLALARLPVRARPQDVEVFLAPALAELPEAVAVLDLGEGGLRGRDATAQMALSLLARRGLGAVLVEGGFGGGAEAAQAAGVPAAGILRDLDGAGQDSAAIRRQLDDAARRAGQDGEAVVLGRLLPETLEALAAWTVDRRAQEVTMAPVSALLGAAP